MSSLLPEPVPSAGNGLPASAPAAAASSPAFSLLLLVIVLAALITLLARGLSLDEALEVLGASGVLTAELRQRLS